MPFAMRCLIMMLCFGSSFSSGSNASVDGASNQDTDCPTSFLQSFLSLFLSLTDARGVGSRSMQPQVRHRRVWCLSLPPTQIRTTWHTCRHGLAFLVQSLQCAW